MKKKWKQFLEIHDQIVEGQSDDENVIGPYVAM